MYKLVAMGEALIDMIPNDYGKYIREIQSFSPNVGGAPANVCGAYTKLGGEAYLITQLGEDPFGDKIVNVLENYHIHTDYICRTKKANTGLAFVSLTKEGERDFSFYRNPSSDMLLEPNQIKKEWFNDLLIFHFCSVDLIDFPIKKAHEIALKFAKENNGIISFDPNIRFNLWDSKIKLRQTILEFISYANVLKVSEEELHFITGIDDEKEAIHSLFIGEVSIILCTKGKEGAIAYTKQQDIAKVKGIKVNTIDTTGAGDAFIGSFLYQLSLRCHSLFDLENITKEDLLEMLTFANRYASTTVQVHGALPSYPSIKEIIP